MRNSKSTALLLAFLIAGLLLILSACGSSTSQGNSRSSVTDATSATTSDQSSGCADLMNSMDSLAGTIEASLSGSSPAESISIALANWVVSLNNSAENVPGAIRDDWKTIISGIQEYANALSGIDVATFGDPATQEKLTAAQAVMDGSKFLTASENVKAWVTANCPSFATS